MKKEIILKNHFTVQMKPNGEVEVNIDAEAALKAIGMAYGLYSRAEDNRDQCVVLDTDHIPPVLLVQEDVVHHGAPLWKTTDVLTQDKAQIDAYMKFREVLHYIKNK